MKKQNKKMKNIFYLLILSSLLLCSCNPKKEFQVWMSINNMISDTPIIVYHQGKIDSVGNNWGVQIYYTAQMFERHKKIIPYEIPNYYNINNWYEVFEPSNSSKIYFSLTPKMEDFKYVFLILFFA